MTDNVTNFLASGIEIKGTIRFQNDMHIDGKIEGEIISDKGKVTIGETAQIKGDITAGDFRPLRTQAAGPRRRRHEDPQPGHGRRRPSAGPHGNRLRPGKPHLQAVPPEGGTAFFMAGTGADISFRRIREKLQP